MDTLGKLIRYLFKKQHAVICLLCASFQSLLLVHAHAQNYITGTAVCDTISPNMKYVAGCSDDLLGFRIDSVLIPYVTGLTFQVEITATSGIVLSNVANADTIKTGDKFSLPAPNESGILRLGFTRVDDSFSFITRIVGTPEVASETYYCNLFYSLTVAGCGNWFDISIKNDSVCTVQSSPNSVADFTGFPKQYRLAQNYPNPFNPSTNISYSIPTSDFVSLKVYDVLGKEIKTLRNELQQAGTYSIHFDKRELSSGIYFYRLQVGSSFGQTKKMLLMR